MLLPYLRSARQHQQPAPSGSRAPRISSAPTGSPVRARRVPRPISGRSARWCGRAGRASGSRTCSSRPPPRRPASSTHPEVGGEVALAFVCFCMLSSATYLLNDVHDREEDRRHPRRRGRPVAAGSCRSRLAVATALALALAGLALAAARASCARGRGGGLSGAHRQLHAVVAQRRGGRHRGGRRGLRAARTGRGRRRRRCRVALVFDRDLLRRAVPGRGQALRRAARGGARRRDARVAEGLLGAVPALRGRPRGDGHHHRVLPVGLPALSPRAGSPGTSSR